jgi:hypothetical protein
MTSSLHLALTYIIITACLTVNARYPLLEYGYQLYSRRLSGVGLPADVTYPPFVDDTNTVPVTAQSPFGKISLLFPLGAFDGMTTPTTIKALLRYLPTAVRAELKRQGFITARALHLFLLEI